MRSSKIGPWNVDLKSLDWEFYPECVSLPRVETVGMEALDMEEVFTG